jgi:threonine/homoserine/homoserine lactone efflux protein
VRLFPPLAHPGAGKDAFWVFATLHMVGADFFVEPTLSKVFLGSFVIGFSGAVSPGPVLARTISQVPRHGFLTGPIIIVGHMFLELALVLGLAFGLGRILQGKLAFSIIGFVGGIVLLGFAVSMLRSLPRLTLDLSGSSSRESTSKRGLVRDGVITSIANPYWTLWWATIGLSYIALAQPLGVAGLVVFFVGHVLSDYAWYALVSGAIAAGRRHIPDWAYRGLTGLCALGLGYFGVTFVFAAIQRYTEAT